MGSCEAKFGVPGPAIAISQCIYVVTVRNKKGQPTLNAESIHICVADVTIKAQKSKCDVRLNFSRTEFGKVHPAA